MDAPEPNRTDGSIPTTSEIRVEVGYLTVQFVADIGSAIDLNKLRHSEVARREDWQELSPLQAAAAERGSFNPSSPPFVFSINVQPVSISGAESERTAVVALSDAGALSVVFKVNLSERMLSDLVGFSSALYDCKELRDEALLVAARILPAIAWCTDEPLLCDDLEDYVCFVLDKLEGEGATELLSTHQLALTQILLGETRELSDELIESTLDNRMSFYKGDLAIFDWRGSLCIGGGWEDVVALLQFANVELLSLRHLKQDIEALLCRRREQLCSGRRWLQPRLWFGSWLIEVQKMVAITQSQLDRIDNPLNLTGDSFLARCYESIAEVLAIDAERTAVSEQLGRLSELESIISDRSAVARADIFALLGVLVAFEFVLSGVERVLDYGASAMPYLITGVLCLGLYRLLQPVFRRIRRAKQ